MKINSKYHLCLLSVALFIIVCIVYLPSNMKLQTTEYRLASRFVSSLQADLEIENGFTTVENNEVNYSCRKKYICINSSYPEPFKIHIYDSPENLVSHNYKMILSNLRKSKYYTSNISEAAAFILPYDTTDRDENSHNYNKDLQTQINKLTNWNNGANHVVFVLFAGKPPFYKEIYNFNVSKSILVKASFSDQTYRANYDLSFPLFKPTLWSRDIDPMEIIGRRRYLLVFKGKRYVHGFGSVVRNHLYKIHNGRDVIMLTTCIHGRYWQQHADARCQGDIENYALHSYDDLLLNSTFCLVPRGRRLGSFRFLEVIQRGCIPVVMSDHWLLPFQEVIDWSLCSLRVKEEQLLALPRLLKEISEKKILSMRKQLQFVYHKYFSSLEKIIYVALEIVRQRFEQNHLGESAFWNRPPGALHIFPEFSSYPSRYPFYKNPTGESVTENFTVCIYVSNVNNSSNVINLIRSLNEMQSVDKIIVSAPLSLRDEITSFIHNSKRSICHVSHDNQSIIPPNTKCLVSSGVFSIDSRFIPSSKQIVRSYVTWRLNPDRLILLTNQIKPNATRDEDYLPWLMMTPVAMFYHRYYGYALEKFRMSVNRTIQYQKFTLANTIINLTSSRPALVGLFAENYLHGHQNTSA